MKASSNIKKHKLMKSEKYVIYIYKDFLRGRLLHVLYICNSLDPPLQLIKLQKQSTRQMGEFALFRGTDGLDFDILRITKPVKRKKLGPRTKITGNFLTEQMSIGRVDQ